MSNQGCLPFHQFPDLDLRGFWGNPPEACVYTRSRHEFRDVLMVLLQFQNQSHLQVNVNRLENFKSMRVELTFALMDCNRWVVGGPGWRVAVRLWCHCAVLSWQSWTSMTPVLCGIESWGRSAMPLTKSVLWHGHWQASDLSPLPPGCSYPLWPWVMLSGSDPSVPETKCPGRLTYVTWPRMGNLENSVNKMHMT
jgi:hypothetical protein